jgi:hypothetical protein
MENFARRGIRTTVAVAGLAALGVGLAAPTAFALPSAPDISGVGNTQAVPSPTDAARAGAPGALPGPFQFTPPAADQSTATDAAPSRSSGSSRTAEPADEESTESGTTEPTEAGEPTEADESEATEEDPSGSRSESRLESGKAATTPSSTTQGLLPAIPGSPVAAQASPQVSGVDPSSALQSLDSGSMF